LSLFTEAEFEVRFFDCDPLGIVWHGNYAKYFEIGRDAFSKKYEIDFEEIFHKHNYSSPLTSIDMSFKRPLEFKDIAIVRATFRPTDTPKVIFDYLIYKKSTGEKICTGSTTQVFVTRENRQLSLTIPAFYEAWKKTVNL